MSRWLPSGQTPMSNFSGGIRDEDNFLKFYKKLQKLANDIRSGIKILAKENELLPSDLCSVSGSDRVRRDNNRNVSEA